MLRLVGFLKYVIVNFGPILVFYGTQHFYGLKLAILFSVIFAAGGILMRKLRKEPIPRFFKITAGVTLLFGIIDLSLRESIFFKYEASLVNLLFAAYFVYTAVAPRRPLVLEFYEQTKATEGKPFTETRYEVIQYFRLLTVAWAGYFTVKSVIYFWVARNYTIEQAMVIRATAGNISLYAMVFLSVFLGKKLFSAAKRMGLLRQA